MVGTMKELKLILYQCFECPKRVAHVTVHLVVFLFVLASLAINLFLETSEQLDPKMLDLLLCFEVALAVYFSIELVLRLWMIDIVPKYRGFRGRIRYMVSLNFALDIIIIASTVLICCIMFSENRALKREHIENLCFVHLLRLMHIDRSAYTWNLFKRVFNLHRTELTSVAILATLILLFITTVLYYLDQPWTNENSMAAFGSSAYLTIMMYLTIGYGDVVPTVWFSKVFASLMCWIAISLLSVTATVLSVGLALLVHDKNVKKLRERKRPMAAQLIQDYYRCYAISNKFDRVLYYKDTLVKRLVEHEQRDNHEQGTLERFESYATFKWIRNLSKVNLKIVRSYTAKEEPTTKFFHDANRSRLGSGDKEQPKVSPLAKFHIGQSQESIPRSLEGVETPAVCPRAPKRPVAQFQLRQYKWALLFLWKMKFLRTKQQLKNFNRSPDLAQMSQQINDNEMAQLHRLNQLQYTIDKMIAGRSCVGRPTAANVCCKLDSALLDKMHYQLDILDRRVTDMYNQLWRHARRLKSCNRKCKVKIERSKSFS